MINYDKFVMTSYDYIIVYHKTDNLTYLGHLDFQHLWERLFRAIKLPIRYSEGFHPVMKLNLIQPLGIGVTGMHEYLHVSLVAPISVASVMDSLVSRVPSGLTIVKIVPTKYNAKWFHRHKASVLYDLTLSKPVNICDYIDESHIRHHVALSKKHHRLTLTNTLDKQLNLRNLFSHDENPVIIDAKRVGLRFTI